MSQYITQLNCFLAKWDSVNVVIVFEVRLAKDYLFLWQVGQRMNEL